MKNRNWHSKACILSLDELASSHKIATVLIEEENEEPYILQATLFGGAKSKLAGFIIPYYTGILYLYTNPVKDSHKITDFQVEKMRFAIRESLPRIWAASFAVEVCIKMKGINWELINAFFDGIAMSDATECKRGVLRFIWRLAHTSGLAPHFYGCSNCKKCDASGLYFDHTTGEFFCSSCTFNKHSSSFLTDEAIQYLYKIQYCIPQISRCTVLSDASASHLAIFLFRLITSITGSELYSLAPQNPLYQSVKF